MIVYLICYAASWIFARFGLYYLSGAALFLAAGYLYAYDYRRSGNLIHLRGLFSCFWVGGQGAACLKLSKLQTDWALQTWICFFLALVGFWITFEVLDRLMGGNERFTMNRYRQRSTVRPLFFCIVGLTVISAAAFVTEAAVLGFIPVLVRGVPHAYSAFHMTGLHYVTVSCVLIPAMTVLYFEQGGSWSGRKNGLIVLCALFSIAIPILCVSRFQLVFAVILAVFTFCASQKNVSPWLFVAAVVALIPCYVLLTVARSHDVTYLNGIFEMKNAATPIFITQPYMYIANNYDNFDCLVRELPAHSMGLKGMFPLWALSGLKFIKPALVDWPIYVNKEELTTVTLFYDAYYDFGIAGVFLFSSVLGAAAAWLSARTYPGRNPAWYLFYSQGALYFMLSFFTTWYSNPTTWFYFVVTGAFGIFLEIKYNRRRRQL